MWIVKDPELQEPMLFVNKPYKTEADFYWEEDEHKFVMLWDEMCPDCPEEPIEVFLLTKQQIEDIKNEAVSKFNESLMNRK